MATQALAEKSTRMDIGGDESKNEPINVNISAEEFDLESYANNYSGHTRIARLLFIAAHCKALEVDALKMAIDDLKKTMNTSLYKEACTRATGKLPASYAYDQSWVDSVEKKAIQLQEKLEVELNGYRTNLIKESTRMGHNDLGDFHYNRGDLNTALKCYLRTRDYCTTSKHIIQMCLNVIRVSIEMANYAHVVNYVAKAEQTPELTDKIVASKLKVASGLANLENRKYKLAAKKFIETSFDLGSNFTEVISQQDVATYGGLCALASFDRSELKKLVIDSPSFRNFLELTPDIRELINDFHSSHYASCLKYLEKIKPALQLDLHLHDHVESLYQKIRNKALIQYFSPFTSIDLNTMAEAFNTSVAGLEKELSRLIMDNMIQARIDSHNKRLYARQTDQRSTTFQKTLTMGDDFQENTKAMLLRVNLLKNEIMVKAPRVRDEHMREKKM